MRCWPWLIGVALCSCSASNKTIESRRSQPQPSAAGGAATEPVSLGSGTPPQSVLLEMPVAAPEPEEEAIVEGDCEVGKFCKPTTPDPDNCGTLTLGQEIEVRKIPGNLLLVFDQSASMVEPWGTTGQTKLQAAQGAIRNAIMSLQDSLTVGALFFPTYGCVGAGRGPGGLGGPGGALPLPNAGGQLPGGLPGAAGAIVGGPGGMAVEPIDGMGQIPFQEAPLFLQSWDAHWSMLGVGMGAGTPMQEAFDRANEAIGAAQPEGALAVVAVTDGAPNCFPAGTNTDLEVNRASNWLAERGIKTYVVGLPGAQGVQLLNDVAAQGGTTQYMLPDDPQALEDQLRTLIQQTTKTVFDSCSIHLTPAADPPDGLLMIVREATDDTKRQVPHMLTPTAGWTITPDGSQVEIVGDLCSDAMTGRFKSITFEYPCKEGEPIPPLSPS